MPHLPPGRTVLLPGRGETFVRTLEGPPDALPLLLLHGWMGTADLNWFTTFPALANTSPVVAPDLRGHGRGIAGTGGDFLTEAADDAAALIRTLGWERAVVGGYSMGVAVSLLLARRHPDLVAGLALSAGALHWTGIGRRLLLRRGGWDGTRQRLTAGRAAARKLAERSHPSLTAVRPWMAAEMERGHPGELRRAGHSLGRFDARAWAPGLRITASVVVTESDRLVRSHRQRTLAETLGATTVAVVDADHDAPAAEPDVFARAFAAAVADVRARDSQRPAA